MTSADAYEVLQRAYQEIVEDPRYAVEGLDQAACGPHVKSLAKLAIAAADNGDTAERWKGSVLQQAGPDAVPLLEQAEECMRQVGLWPWHDAARTG